LRPGSTLARRQSEALAIVGVDVPKRLGAGDSPEAVASRFAEFLVLSGFGQAEAVEIVDAAMHIHGESSAVDW
jgi:hypothetical protein